MNRSKEVEVKFYNMCFTADESCSTVETLFESINQQLIKDGISWQQCVSFGLNNTSDNIDTKYLITLAEEL